MPLRSTPKVLAELDRLGEAIAAAAPADLPLVAGKLRKLELLAEMRLRQALAEAARDELQAVVGRLVELEEAARSRLTEAPAGGPETEPQEPASIYQGARTDAGAGEGLVSPHKLRTMVGGLSRGTIHRLVQQGAFPAPIVLSRTKRGHPCRIAWVESEVRQWCVEKIREARGSG